MALVGVVNPSWGSPVHPASGGLLGNGDVSEICFLSHLQ